MADLLNVRVSAPGKVILFGEHAVVYGKLAVAASLDLRTYVTFKEEKGNKLQIHFENLDFEKKFHITVLNSILKNTDFNTFKEKYNKMWKHPENLNANEFVSIIKKSLNINSETLSLDHFKSMMSFFCIYFGMFLSSNTNVFPANVSVKTSLSLGSGTGSSASFMVSLAAAVLKIICSKNPAAYPGDSSDGHDLKSNTFNEIELNLISKWAYFAEKIIHGNPSGIDNTICTYGSFLSFRKTRAPIPIIIKANIKGLLVDTMVPKNTLALVQKVAQLNEKHPKIFENICNTIECIADEAIDTLIQLSETSENDKELIKKHYKCLEELTAMNHHLLRSLEVSHPSLEKVIEIMKKHNVVGKLTGAGGGGYAIALISPINGHSDVSQLCNELSMEGYTANIVKLGAPGVRIEE